MQHQPDAAERERWGEARRHLDDASAGRSVRLIPPQVREQTALEEFATVVERLPVGVVIVDVRLEVTYANHAASRILHPFRARRGGALPDPWPEFSLRAYAELLFSPGFAPDERVEVGDHAYDVSGITARGTGRAAILLTDVTSAQRRRRAEHEFVANAAHELLTPLTGIVAAAHVLEAGAKEIPEDRDHFIAHIAHECTRLAKIARALLVLARAQSGEQPPRLDVLHLCGILEEAVELAGFDSGSVQLDCARDITVFADPDLLTQAMTNLLTNAARHRSGGVVDVAVNEEIRGKVAVTVSNAGATSEEALGDRRRFESPGGPDTGGFGLGISIARQSIEVLGGTLAYDTDDSTVHARVLLPAGVIRA